MNEKFYNLPEERQERIINAAMEVFSKTSYRHAATDDIIKAAGISKGLLFHYFENKKTLYAYIYDFAVHYINLELKANADGEEKGYFDTIADVERTFLETCSIYPYLRHFLIKCEKEADEEILTKTNVCRKLWADTLEEIFEKADYTIFSEEKDTFMSVIDFTLNGILAKFDCYSQDVFDEISKYLSFFKRILPA